MTKATSTGAVHIVLIDDDDAVLDSLRLLLQVEGFDVSTFPGAIEYLAAAAAEDEPSCIIVDLHMPGMSGLELVKRLRADGHDVPVIMLTAALGSEVRSQATAAGVDHLLSKPPSDTDLLSVIHHCAGDGEGEAADATPAG